VELNVASRHVVGNRESTHVVPSVGGTDVREGDVVCQQASNVRMGKVQQK
jgi:hypothetical protein